MLINEGVKYERSAFDSEAELEAVVEQHAEYLFGSSIVYLAQKTISTVGGAGTIPDAIVINVENREWFVVEAELASHGTWSYIAPQVSKQLAAVESPETRDHILSIALKDIDGDGAILEIFGELGVKQLSIHGVIQKILAKRPIVAIPIDAIPKDLEDWIRTLRHQVKIWVVEKYTSPSAKPSVLYSIPDENFPSLVTTTTGKGTKVKKAKSQPWQDLIGTDLLPEGTPLSMRYGPHGKPKKTYHGVARAAGIEIDGKVMSPSAAAIQCIRSAGSNRKTANGWVRWKTKDGTLITDLYQQLPEHS